MARANIGPTRGVWPRQQASRLWRAVSPTSVRPQGQTLHSLRCQISLCPILALTECEELERRHANEPSLPAMAPPRRAPPALPPAFCASLPVRALPRGAGGQLCARPGSTPIASASPPPPPPQRTSSPPPKKPQAPEYSLQTRLREETSAPFRKVRGATRRLPPARPSRDAVSNAFYLHRFASLSILAQQRRRQSAVLSAG